MQSFRYYAPTEVVFGKEAELQTAMEIKKYGGSRVALIYGGGSVQRSGLLQRVERLLDEAGLAHFSLGGVRPNPRLSLVRTGVEQALEFHADFVLAVGGGSVIDSAKAIAHGAANPGTDVWKFWTGEAELKQSLPVGSILTISAAGSETSDSAVITDEATQTKRGLNTVCNRPRFAIMNPELTFTLPPYQISCGIVDIMMHTLERYFTPTKGNDLTDEFAESLLRVVIRNGPAALVTPEDYEAMSELMWCGSVSHNGLTGLGAATDFATHKIGHELSGKFDVAHGASLSAVWGSWARYVCAAGPERFARLSEKVWGKDADAETGIRATEDFFRSVNMPVCFTELGIGVQNDAVLSEMAAKATRNDTLLLGNFKKLNREDVLRIYQAANH